MTRYSDIKSIHINQIKNSLGHGDFKCHDAEYIKYRESCILLRVNNIDFYAYFTDDVLTDILKR